MDFSALDPMAWVRKLAERSPDTAEERARKALGVLDATAAMGSGLLSQAVGGAVALPWALIPGETSAADVLEDVSGRLPAYKPQTEYGQEILGALGAPGGLGEKIDAPFRWVGDRANDASNAMGLPAEVGGLAGSLAYTAANLVGPIEAAQAVKALPGIVKNAAIETAAAGAASPIMTLRVPKPDLDAYQALRSSGKSDVEAFRETGVFEDAMGQLRKWQSDADMELLPDQGKTRKDPTRNELYTRTILGDRVAGYPLLDMYEGSPDLPLMYREGLEPTSGALAWKGDPVNGGYVPSQMQVGVGRNGLPDQAGGIPAGEIVRDERLTIAHEGQHAADIWDGLEGGTSPDRIPIPPEMAEKGQLYQEVLEIVGGMRTPDQADPRAVKVAEDVASGRVDAEDVIASAKAHDAQVRRFQHGAYRNNWGEALARAGERILETGARTPDELLRSFPGGPMGALDVEPSALWQGGQKAGSSAKVVKGYRGEHGEPGADPFQTRLPSVTFSDDPSVASAYAERPNARGDVPVAPRVIPAKLDIRRPLIESEDPFVDLKDIAGKLGREKADYFARKHANAIENTDNWRELTGGITTVADALDADPAILDQLYLDAYPLLDDPEFIRAARAAGYDGAIHGGNGTGAGTLEYRVFDPKQARGIFDDGIEDVGAAKGPRETLAPSAFQEVDPRAFDQQLAAARQAMEAGGDKRSALQVDAQLPADFKGKVYMTPDGLAGFAVSDTGYVSNLFKHPSAQYSDVMGAVLQRARDAGGKTLDAFDTGLAAGYGKRGAVETGRSPWNPEYAPQGWDEKTMGTPDYVAMTLPSKKAWEQIQKIRGMSPEHADFINNALKYLTPAEWERLNAKTFGKLRGFMGDMTSVDDLVNMAFAGKAKKGWYRESAEAIQRIFGDDAERFSGLLAALSPQTSVESNLENALRVWGAWKKAGSPTDDASLMRILSENVQSPGLPQRSRAQLEQMSKRLGIKFRKGTKKGTLIARINDFAMLSPQNAQRVKEMSVLPAWTNNSLRALKSQGGLRLSGPKVDSFMRNLLGDLHEVTNDTWQAKALNVLQKFFGGQAIKAGGEKLGAKGPGYLAGNIQTRQAAEQLTKITGESWTPAEVQETVWSFVKALSELADENKLSLEDAWQHPDFTNQRVAGIPDFGTLMRTSPRYSRLLEDAGYGEKLKELQIHLSDRFVGEAAEGTPRTLSGGPDRELARRLERGRELNAKGLFE